MAYCGQSDLSERYGDKELKELTDEVSGSTIAVAEVTSACNEASSQIDVYLGQRYPVPLASPPAIVTGWACALARLKLWGDRASKDSAVRVDADDVIAILKDIARGNAKLPGQDVATSAIASAASMVERTKVMTDTELDKRVSMNPAFLT